MKKIGVIGFGKIGQAISANMIRHSEYKVVAVDTAPGLPDAFSRSSFSSNEPGVEKILTDAYKKGQLKLRNDFSEMENAEAVILSLPLLVNEEKKTIDAPFLESLQQLSPYCKDQLLIIIETSVPVGYCRAVLLPVLEAKGKKHGIDFLLAHSPERIKSGTMLEQLDKVPKIIGGITPEATSRACEIYAGFFKKELLHCLDSIEAAELLKLAGMIYRDVNIALSNQLAMFAHKTGIDFPDLLPLINTDGEAHLLQPGIGVGGHCTPVYPYFLINNFREAGLEFGLASMGRNINESMAAYAFSLVKEKLATRKALILGLSFRPDVKEDANSPGSQLYKILEKEGFDVSLHDTEYSTEELEEKGFATADPDTAKVEVIFLTTMHSQYRRFDFNKMASNGVRYLVDGRNALPKEAVESAGITYIGIGKG
ncbi:MAG TPA: nucleotide sugar dehydrogenase [Chitinophagaceae bacterium]|nr:nucleotide sugar dehydrogenase [Chitinophagaceae bacterium]